MAVILVEKKRQWPIRRYHLILKSILKRFHPRLPRMLKCTVCTSFWTTLVAELCVLFISYLYNMDIYWMWPLSGFVTAGITWTIMDFLISFANISEKRYI